MHGFEKYRLLHLNLEILLYHFTPTSQIIKLHCFASLKVKTERKIITSETQPKTSNAIDAHIK